MPEEPRVNDPKVLRALAHPVRMRILDELEASGPLRAADVARALDVAPNLASFHLRQLAKYGLVEEAPEEARDKRDRVWRPTASASLNLDLRRIADAPGGRAAVRVFSDNKRAWGHHLVDRAFDTQRPAGSGVFTVSESALRLSDDEVHDLRAELDAVVESWAQRTRGRDAQRRTHVVHTMVQPYPEDAGS